jgi:UPF0716 protein FxsA
MVRLALGLVLVVLPMLELILLLKIGQSIGILPTVALVVVGALVGAFVIARQSLTVLTRTLEALSEGRPPVEPVLDGLFLLLAGALLLMPGVITDVVGLALLVPPLRRTIAHASMRWLVRRTRVWVETADEEAAAYGRRPRRPGDGTVIDVEYEPVGEERPGRQDPG